MLFYIVNNIKGNVIELLDAADKLKSALTRYKTSLLVIKDYKVDLINISILC